MKHSFIFSALLIGLCSACLQAQNTPATTEEKTYEMYDIAKGPSFPGGEREMYQFISTNMKYPALARENGIQGIVVVSFLVGKDGSITESTILKDIGGGCGKEARRIVESMPKWSPGEANGNPVKVRYTLPFRFKLEDDVAPVNDEAPPPPPEEARPASREQMLEIVSGVVANILKSEAVPTRNSALSIQTFEEKKLLLLLETACKTKFSEADKKGIKQVGDLSDYLYKSQYAPLFFENPYRKGRSLRLLTSRADFDANADGMGKLGALIVPNGVKVVLYSKKNFKGKKLEINAKGGDVHIIDMNQLPEIKGILKNGDKNFNGGVGTQSVKILLPKGFPEGK